MSQADIFGAGLRRLQMTDSIELTIRSLQAYGATPEHWSPACSGGSNSSATLTLVAVSKYSAYLEKKTAVLRCNRDSAKCIFENVLRLLVELRKFMQVDHTCSFLGSDSVKSIDGVTNKVLSDSDVGGNVIAKIKKRLDILALPCRNLCKIDRQLPPWVLKIIFNRLIQFGYYGLKYSPVVLQWQIHERGSNYRRVVLLPQSASGFASGQNDRPRQSGDGADSTNPRSEIADVKAGPVEKVGRPSDDDHRDDGQQQAKRPVTDDFRDLIFHCRSESILLNRSTAFNVV